MSKLLSSFNKREDISSVGPAVVFGERLSAPGLDLCPGLRGIGPERMAGWQTEGHEGQRGHVERTVVGVPVGSQVLTLQMPDCLNNYY